MRINTVLLLIVGILSTFECTLAKDCSVRLADSSDMWDDYHISADNSYTFTAICRCSVGKPKWTYYTDTSNGEIDKANEPYCLNDTEQCTLGYIPLPGPEDNCEKESGLFIDLKLVNYTVTKSTLLLCKSTNFNYARGISVVITNTTTGKDTVTSTSTVTVAITSITTTTTAISTTTVCPTSTSTNSTTMNTSGQETDTPSSNINSNASTDQLKNECDSYKYATIAVCVVGLGFFLLLSVILITIALRCKKKTNKASDTNTGNGEQMGTKL